MADSETETRLLENLLDALDDLDSLDRLALSSEASAAEPWARIAILVNESGSDEAADNFNAMSQELALEKPRKSVLKSLWGGLVGALPTITELVSLGEQISQLFKLA